MAGTEHHQQCVWPLQAMGVPGALAKACVSPLEGAEAEQAGRKLCH